MATGLTSTGFVAERVTDILEAIEADELLLVDPALDLSAEMPLGQLNGIMSERLANVWEVLSLCYNGLNRDNAEGPQLDNIGQLTGTTRDGASPTIVECDLVFSAAGTFIPGQLIANISGVPGAQFSNGSTIVVTSGQIGSLLHSNEFIALVDGPQVCNATTLTHITTPVVGWSSISNPLDGVIGSLVEQDQPYRQRQVNEIAAEGASTPDAIRADVLQVPGVLECTILENEGDFYDANGQQPHSINAVIWDGIIPQAANNDIAQALWNDKASGTAYIGTQSGVALDSQGNQRVMGFTRVTQLNLYLTIGCTMMKNVPFTADVAAAIKQAIVAATQVATIDDSNGTPVPNPAFLGPNSNVIASAIVGAILDSGNGVADVTLLELGFSPSPVGTINLPVGLFQIAVADTSRILINGI